MKNVLNNVTSFTIQEISSKLYKSKPVGNTDSSARYRDKSKPPGENLKQTTY